MYFVWLAVLTDSNGGLGEQRAQGTEGFWNRGFREQRA